MHLTRGPCVECSAPHTRLHCSMLWTKLCVISVGPASLDLLLCVLMCFGSGHCWEIAAHLCGCLRNKRGREVCFYLKHSVGLKRGIVCKMSLIPWGFLSSFRPSYSPGLADSGLEEDPRVRQQRMREMTPNVLIVSCCPVDIGSLVLLGL